MDLITVSIVSHGHGELLPDLLSDLLACPEVDQIILVMNLPERTGVLRSSLASQEQVVLVENSAPKGFGVNHNAAFRYATTPYFLVLNPDVRLMGNPFPELLACMQDEDVSLCAPVVLDPDGRLEDSARRFPTVPGLLLKGLRLDDGRLHYDARAQVVPAPWVAGMFMLFRSVDYAALGGFDEGFFLYYEDVDICARIWRVGKKIVLCPHASIVHDARRASRRHFRFMLRHASSMLRYFRKHGLYSLESLHQRNSS